MRLALAVLLSMLQCGRPLFGARCAAAALRGSPLAASRRVRAATIRAEAATKEPSVAEEPTEAGPTMEEIINVCKRRGIIFQSSEVRARARPRISPRP